MKFRPKCKNCFVLGYAPRSGARILPPRKGQHDGSRKRSIAKGGREDEPREQYQRQKAQSRGSRLTTLFNL